ncbi:MAG: hypothetical protein MOB07_00415 [Acidobacteria bacterium]|nr:hypothetical protein [Acidobacteriota bacterium]
MLAKSLPDVEDENVPREALRLRELEEQRNLVERFIILAFVFIIIGLGVFVMIETGNIGAGILLFTLAAGMAALSAYDYGHRRKKVSAQHPPPTAPLDETTTKLQPEHQAQIPTSVTEPTTARLGEKLELHR